jgi:hypothetical protein
MTVIMNIPREICLSIAEYDYVVRQVTNEEALVDWSCPVNDLPTEVVARYCEVCVPLRAKRDELLKTWHEWIILNIGRDINFKIDDHAAD